MKIKNLEELRKYADEETVRKICMEYFMEISGKAMAAESSDIEEAYRKGYEKGHGDAETGI